MSLLNQNWSSTLPTLEEVDAYIDQLRRDLQRAEEFREGVRLIRMAVSAQDELRLAPVIDAEWRSNDALDLEAWTRLSAKDALIKVLRDAGEPLAWSELQRRVLSLPNPPSASAITSAYYHNTKAGDRCFLPIPGGYAGLTDRDEGWQPRRTVSPGEQVPTVRDLVEKYLRENHEFHTEGLVSAVQEVIPGALRHTIRAQLSHAKKRKQAQSLTRGRWRSLIYNVLDDRETLEIAGLPPLPPPLELLDSRQLFFGSSPDEDA